MPPEAVKGCRRLTCKVKWKAESVGVHSIRLCFKMQRRKVLARSAHSQAASRRSTAHAIELAKALINGRRSLNCDC